MANQTRARRNRIDDSSQSSRMHPKSLTKVFRDKQRLNETTQTPSGLNLLQTQGSRSGLSNVTKGSEDRTSTPDELTAADVLHMRFLLFTGAPGPGERLCVAQTRSKAFQLVDTFRIANNRWDLMLVSRLQREMLNWLKRPARSP